MKYILINQTEKIHQKYKSDDLNELVQEFQGHIMYDINLLKSFGFSDLNKIYESYVIYKYTKSPISKKYIIVDTLKYDEKLKTFKTIEQVKDEPISSQKSVDNAIDIIKPTISNLLQQTDDFFQKKDEIKLFDISYRKNKIEEDEISETTSEESHDEETDIETSEEDKISESSSDSSEDEETEDENIEELSDSVDASYLKQIKEKINRLKKLQSEKEDKIKKYDEQHHEIQEHIADSICEINLTKKQDKFKKEKYDEGKRKFDIDKEVFLKIKDENNCKNKLPPFFIHTFDILKEMDENNQINDEKSYDIFLEKYEQYTKSHTINNDDDRYGIL